MTHMSPTGSYQPSPSKSADPALRVERRGSPLFHFLGLLGSLGSCCARNGFCRCHNIRPKLGRSLICDIACCFSSMCRDAGMGTLCLRPLVASRLMSPLRRPFCRPLTIAANDASCEICSVPGARAPTTYPPKTKAPGPPLPSPCTPPTPQGIRQKYDACC